MTSPNMIAVMVILVALFVAIIITVAFVVLDRFEKKNCSHFCKLCKYKKKCDYYLNKK